MSRRETVILAADYLAAMAVLVGLFSPTHNAAVAAMAWSAGWLMRGLALEFLADVVGGES